MHRLGAISSMATREVLGELAVAYRHRAGVDVAIESVGGVDAARRVGSGEPFDIVVLAQDAIASLESAGRVVPASRVEVASSGIAVAVRAGAALPDISTEDAVRIAVLEAPSIGYSTGPSGSHLLRLLERWGIAAAIQPRLVKAAPGVPVGTLVASGEALIGFQQLSELVHLRGITVVAALPPAIQLMTLFSAGVCAASSQREAAGEWLAFIASPERDEVKRRHGMQPPSAAQTRT